MRFSANLDGISSSRADLLSAISERALYEHDINSGEKTAVQLSRYYDRATKLDAFTLAYASATALDWHAHINSHRRTGDRFNIYAISKLWEVSRVLNGGSFDTSGNDGMTCAGVVAALSRGITNQKRIEIALNDYATSVRGKTYTAGNTQASSSLRAMEALGIVKRVGRDGTCNVWGIRDARLFAMLVNAADDDAADDDAADADTANNDDGIISADYIDVSDQAALPAPLLMLAHDTASDDGMPLYDAGSAASDDALPTDAEIDAADVSLPVAADADVAVPAKRSRKKRAAAAAV
jgi:hypothetical protein